MQIQHIHSTHMIDSLPATFFPTVYPPNISFLQHPTICVSGLLPPSEILFSWPLVPRSSLECWIQRVEGLSQPSFLMADVGTHRRYIGISACSPGYERGGSSRCTSSDVDNCIGMGRSLMVFCTISVILMLQDSSPRCQSHVLWPITHPSHRQ